MFPIFPIELAIGRLIYRYTTCSYTHVPWFRWIRAQLLRTFWRGHGFDLGHCHDRRPFQPVGMLGWHFNLNGSVSDGFFKLFRPQIIKTYQNHQNSKGSFGPSPWCPDMPRFSKPGFFGTSRAAEPRGFPSWCTRLCCLGSPGPIVALTSKKSDAKWYV